MERLLFPRHQVPQTHLPNVPVINNKNSKNSKNKKLQDLLLKNVRTNINLKVILVLSVELIMSMATVNSFKAEVLGVGPSSERMGEL